MGWYKLVLTGQNSKFDARYVILAKDEEQVKAWANKEITCYGYYDYLIELAYGEQEAFVPPKDYMVRCIVNF
jgi:hypothetical protein